MRTEKSMRRGPAPVEAVVVAAAAPPPPRPPRPPRPPPRRCCRSRRRRSGIRAAAADGQRVDAAALHEVNAAAVARPLRLHCRRRVRRHRRRVRRVRGPPAASVEVVLRRVRRVPSSAMVYICRARARSGARAFFGGAARSHEEVGAAIGRGNDVATPIRACA